MSLNKNKSQELFQYLNKSPLVDSVEIAEVYNEGDNIFTLYAQFFPNELMNAFGTDVIMVLDSTVEGEEDSSIGELLSQIAIHHDVVDATMNEVNSRNGAIHRYTGDIDELQDAFDEVLTRIGTNILR